jgi:hypothetical protein
MSSPIYEWPREWYKFTSTSFPLRSKSQVSSRPWAGGNNVYGPHAQFWSPKFATTVTDKFLWQKVSAFFSRLGGQSGLLRMGHSIRLRPQFNRETKPQVETWSDGTGFTDGTGFVSGLLPPTAFVLRAARRGGLSLQIGGLPPSTVRALRRGDLLEVRIGGIATAVPHLYEVMVDGSTNADGEVGVEIRPPLRGNVAPGDMVVLEFPSSVFHLIDDSQGDIEMGAPSIGAFGFSLIEAIEGG